MGPGPRLQIKYSTHPLTLLGFPSSSVTHICMPFPLFYPWGKLKKKKNLPWEVTCAGPWSRLSAIVREFWSPISLSKAQKRARHRLGLSPMNCWPCQKGKSQRRARAGGGASRARGSRQEPLQLSYQGLWCADHMPDGLYAVMM